MKKARVVKLEHSGRKLYLVIEYDMDLPPEQDDRIQLFRHTACEALRAEESRISCLSRKELANELEKRGA